MHGWGRSTGSSDGLSYAASNLVKPELLRQQSEPPIGRKAFDDGPASTGRSPTPPPKAAGRSYSPENSTQPCSRSQSAPRRPEPLALESSPFAKPTPRSQSLERPRTPRTASDQLPCTASDTTKDNSFSLTLRSKKSRPTLGVCTHSLEPPTTPDNRPISADSSIRRHFKQRPDSIEEEDEGMVNILSAIEAPTSAALAPIEQPRSSSHARRPSFGAFSFRSRQASQDRGYSASQNAAGQLQVQSQPEAQGQATVRTTRLKVHYNEDTRYIITQANVTFSELVSAIAKKFKLKEETFVVKTRDEDGDLITMADQDDLEAACVVCVERAVKEGAEYLRLEVS